MLFKRLSMAIGELFFFIFCGIAAINALFLTVYFLVQREKKIIPNILLCAFIIMGAVRIIKLLLLNLKEEYQIIIPLLLISVPTITLIGPLLHFYVRSVSEKGFKIRWLDSLHALPFVLILALNLNIFPGLNSILNAGPVYNYALKSFILVQLLVYIISSLTYTLRLIKIYKLGYSQKEMVNPYWIRNIVIIVFLLWLIVALYLIDVSIQVNLHAVTIETFFYSTLIFVMLFYELRYRRLTTINNYISKVKTSNISVEEILRYKSLLIYYMKEKEIFKDHNITLGQLAKEISITPHLLSQIINEQFSHNFNDFVNSYRVEEARKMLADPAKNNLTIASIAYDCGFNTLSAFNTAFKKFTGLTPSMFRNNKV